MRTPALRSRFLLVFFAAACLTAAAPASACPGETALACLRIDDAGRRERWAKVLGSDKAQGATYVTAFYRLADHPDPVIGDRAVDALLAMAPRSAHALATVVRDGDFARTHQILQAIGPATEGWKVDVCVAALQDPEERVRRVALLALAPSRDTRAVPGIAALLRDSSPSLRAQAARTLGYLGDARALAPLRHALLDPDPVVRRAAGRSLAVLSGAR